MSGLIRFSVSGLGGGVRPYWIEAFGMESSFNPGTGGPVTVRWAMKTSGATPLGDPFRALTAGEEVNIRASIQAVVAHTGLRLIETTASDPAVNILVGASPGANDTVAVGRAWMYTTQPVVMAAYDHPYSTADGLARNSYIFVHELLHAFGLHHSTERFASTLPVVIPEDEATGTTLFGTWGPAWDQATQLFDIAAMQYLYGPDPGFRAGNDTYRPDPQAYVVGTPVTDGPLIWDGGGYDILDLSQHSTPLFASLRPGVVSRIGTSSERILDAGTFAINHGTVIEELRGGAGDDTLTGHDSGAILRGGAGRDLLIGGLGRDRLDGGLANDRMDGAAGHDRLNGGGGRDRLSGGPGNDTLAGQAGNDQLIGSIGNDRLLGQGGADRIEGGRGRDVMTGGAGVDQFVIRKGDGRDRITDFSDADRLLLDDALWRGSKSVAKVLDDHARATGGGVWLDFGRTEVFLAGVRSIASLQDDITIL